MALHYVVSFYKLMQDRSYFDIMTTVYIYVYIYIYIYIEGIYKINFIIFNVINLII